MGMGTTFISDHLKLICNGTAIANIADNAGSSPLTNLYLSLHTADPSAGNQSTSEISYSGPYARQAIARTASGLLVVGTQVIIVADVTFPTPSGVAAGPATYAALGTLVSGAGKILYAGLLTPAITIQIGNPPIVAANSSITLT